MNALMNQYIEKIQLISDDMTRHLLNVALHNEPDITDITILIKANKYIVDIRLDNFDVEAATRTMNLFMERTRFPYSSLYLRFNEGKQIRYRYATCKESREGFYCDVIIS